MPSFTFSSRKLGYGNALGLLGTALVLYFCALEIGMRTVVPRVSKTEQRIADDRRTAIALRPLSPQGAKTILLVGNSLLLLGVDRRQLAEMMRPSYAVALFPVEGTLYLDWYFGLRRLFAEGSRPAVILLCLSSRQLVSKSTNGEAFARSMMQTRDIVRVAKTASLDMTTTSNFLFANLSAWLGGRWFVRNWLLEKWVSKALVERFTPPNSAVWVTTDEIVEEATARLRAMQELSTTHGSRFMLVMPPTRNVHDPSSRILAEASRTGLDVLVPVEPGSMPANAFSDGFHLNSHGARLFTERLQAALADALLENRPRPGRPGAHSTTTKSVLP